MLFLLICDFMLFKITYKQSLYSSEGESVPVLLLRDLKNVFGRLRGNRDMKLESKELAHALICFKHVEDCIAFWYSYFLSLFLFFFFSFFFLFFHFFHT